MHQYEFVLCAKDSVRANGTVTEKKITAERSDYPMNRMTNKSCLLKSGPATASCLCVPFDKLISSASCSNFFFSPAAYSCWLCFVDVSRCNIFFIRVMHRLIIMIVDGGRGGGGGGGELGGGCFEEMAV